MAAGLGSDVHTDGQTLEQCMWRNVYLMYCYPLLNKRSHGNTAPWHTRATVCNLALPAGVQRQNYTGVHRHYTLSSLISISPPPSWLGWLSGHDCWSELASSLPSSIARLPCLLLYKYPPCPIPPPPQHSPRLRPYLTSSSQHSHQPHSAALLPLIPHSLSTNNQVSIDAPTEEQQPCHRARPACSFANTLLTTTCRSDLHLHTSP